MKLIGIDRDTLLNPVARAASACGRGPLPILSNLLIKVADGRITVTGSDLQVEVTDSICHGDIQVEDGAVCIPAKKLHDILKNMQSGTAVSLDARDGKAILKAGRSRFSLSTLPAADFPNVEANGDSCDIRIQAGVLRTSIERVKHAMARKDVRYYLNGVLLHVKNSKCQFVATDGHRLAYTETTNFESSKTECSSIIPAESISIISGLLAGKEDWMEIQVSSNHAIFQIGDSKIVTNLIDGKYPDFERVLPKGRNQILEASITDLKLSVSRAAILANEKYRGITLTLSNNNLGIKAANVEAEESEDSVDVNYCGDEMTIGVNGDYLKEALSVMGADKIQLAFSDANSSILVTHPEDGATKLVCMPMRI